MNKKHLLYYGLAALIAVAVLAILIFRVQPGASPETVASAPTLPFPVISEIMKEHGPGSGQPCKSEFPAAWKLQQIKAAILSVVSNTSVRWRTEDNGYDVAEQDIEGVKIRVVVNRKAQQVVTAYPLNVERNPCPEKETAPEPESSQ